ncbi:MerR family transcriptional regulator [Francisella sp. Scap27]|uniref:MerR family transcriptional regulator n=1 Tax=Francisella sp. Scap27 TaxID=2589986 RepID=UPI0015BE2287|nr:MerR family transcriptional regulator [Francisella sp. Scap27]QLE79888.1 MerR family transcriptional regulator [Francisella sp. Scap27]
MQWYTKQISSLTGVSIKALYHYDKIGLLVPIRTSNGYRIYSEKDLIKLQNIIALKAFGFNLKQVKEILSNNLDISKSLNLQLKLLQKQQIHLQSMVEVLEIAITKSKNEKFDFNEISKLIKEHNMQEIYQDQSIKEILDGLEIQQYEQLQKDSQSKKKISAKMFAVRWKNICDEISLNIKTDPNSEYGISIGEKIHAIVYNLYGRKYARLKHAIWYKGFISGKESNAISKETIVWIEQAMQAYFSNRCKNIFMNLGEKEDTLIAEQFGQLLDEMYGCESDLKLVFFEDLYKHPKVPEKTKRWVRKNYKTFI